MKNELIQPDISGALPLKKRYILLAAAVCKGYERAGFICGMELLPVGNRAEVAKLAEAQK